MTPLTQLTPLLSLTDVANVDRSLPPELRHLTFHLDFNEALDTMTLPSGLQTLTLGCRFNRSLDNTTLPSGLQKLTLSACFNQNLDRTTLPSELRELVFGCDFNQSLTMTSCSQSIECVRSDWVGWVLRVSDNRVKSEPCGPSGMSERCPTDEG